MIWNITENSKCQQCQKLRSVQNHLVATFWCFNFLIFFHLGAVIINLPLSLEDLKLAGRMRVTMSLIPTSPYVKTVKLCFLSKPIFDIVLKPGTNSIVDMTELPLLRIKEVLKQAINNYFVHPAIYEVFYFGFFFFFASGFYSILNEIWMLKIDANWEMVSSPTGSIDKFFGADPSYVTPEKAKKEGIRAFQFVTSTDPSKLIFSTLTWYFLTLTWYLIIFFEPGWDHSFS